MSTRNENSRNNFYIFEKPKNTFEKVTYRKNLVAAIQKKCPGALEGFSPDSMTDEKFREFVSEAEKLGYRIYKLTAL